MIAATRPGTIANRLSPRHPQTSIRPLTEADDDFCKALFFEHRGEQFARLGPRKDALATLLAQQYDAQRRGYASQFPDAESFIIAHDGNDIGRLIVIFTASSPADLALHLVDITIAAAARGCGIGSDVIESLARAGRAAGATQLTLLVLQTNDAARRFYERLGFVATTDGPYIRMIRQL